MQIEYRRLGRVFGSLLTLSVLLVACASSSPQVDFRSGDRPEFDRQLSANDVAGILDRGGAVLDVRLKEDFQAHPVLIPEARYRDPELMTEWVSELGDVDGPVVVYCVRGKWVSQKVAHLLDARGIEVYSLEGGIEAWEAEGRSIVDGE